MKLKKLRSKARKAFASFQHTMAQGPNSEFRTIIGSIVLGQFFMVALLALVPGGVRSLASLASAPPVSVSAHSLGGGGEMAILARTTTPDQVKKLKILLEGTRIKTCALDASNLTCEITINTNTLAPGPHEVLARALSINDQEERGLATTTIQGTGQSAAIGGGGAASGSRGGTSYGTSGFGTGGSYYSGGGYFGTTGIGTGGYTTTGTGGSYFTGGGGGLSGGTIPRTSPPTMPGSSTSSSNPNSLSTDQIFQLCGSFTATIGSDGRCRLGGATWDPVGRGDLTGSEIFNLCGSFSAIIDSSGTC